MQSMVYKDKNFSFDNIDGGRHKGKIYFQHRQRVVFFKHDIDIQNILLCATDGAPDITGKHRGFIGLLKKDCQATLAMHCVVHGQHLAAECIRDELSVSLQYVINAVNTINSK